MCSLKTTKLAKYLDEELSKLGYNRNEGDENIFIKKTLADLEDTRKKYF